MSSLPEFINSAPVRVIISGAQGPAAPNPTTPEEKEAFWVGKGLTAYDNQADANAGTLPIGALYYDRSLEIPKTISA